MRMRHEKRGRPVLLFASAALAASLAGGAAPAQEAPTALADRVALPAPMPASDSHVVGMRVFPGARDIATLTLDHPGLRERVAALAARRGGQVVITRLEAGIYRLPGAVGQDAVIAFYNRELERELRAREGSEPAAKLSAGVPGSEARVSALPGGQGYLSITVDPDPLQPRDTRVVVVRVEGSRESQSLLKPLTEIVCAVHLSAAGAAPAVLPAAPTALPRPQGTPISSLPSVPAFPGSQPEAVTRLNTAQVQALIRNLATSRHAPSVRSGITSLLNEARAVTLNVYRVPRPVAGSAVVQYYRAAMTTYGAKEVVADLSDPSRPLLVYTLPAGAGVIMIRAYPEATPLAAFTRTPLSSPISTGISLLRIDGATLKPSARP